jgi:hypothetical protein
VLLEITGDNQMSSDEYYRSNRDTSSYDNMFGGDSRYDNDDYESPCESSYDNLFGGRSCTMTYEVCELTCAVDDPSRWSSYWLERTCELTCPTVDEEESETFYRWNTIACDIRPKHWRTPKPPGFSVDSNGYPQPQLPDHTEASLRKMRLDDLQELLSFTSVTRMHRETWNAKAPYIRAYLSKYKRENEKREFTKRIMNKHNIVIWHRYVKSHTSEDFWLPERDLQKEFRETP